MATQAYAFWGHLTGKLFRYHGDKSSLWDKWTNWNLTESSKKRVKTKHHQISVLLNPETTFELADRLNGTQIESESSRLQRRGFVVSYAADIRVISTFSSIPSSEMTLTAAAKETSAGFAEEGKPKNLERNIEIEGEVQKMFDEVFLKWKLCFL